jgi:hypothetical protein
VDAVPLAGREGDEGAGGALDRFAGRVDRDAAADDVHDGALAYVVVAHRFAALKLDDNGAALGGAEEDARDLPVMPRDSRARQGGAPAAVAFRSTLATT